MASRKTPFQKPAKNRDHVVYSVIFVVACLLIAVVHARSQSNARSHEPEPVFRSPFVLKLHVDGEHYYDETFGRVPYVADDDVYLFAGESFGINVAIIDDQVSQVTYQRDPEKADVEFKFAQEKSPEGFMMLLTTRSKLKRRLFFDAMMTVLERKKSTRPACCPSSQI